IVGLDNTDIFAQKLADQRQVYVVPGRFFGSPAHVRIGFGGKSEEVQVGLKRLADELMTYRWPVGTSRINL
ncbi:MAG: aminotransferase class I/II-fold pyridoxal phosphate-dependent enzyme, partial [Chloroflexi bacterium]|nr:aminotransferase class I/II-fold pyridoxal phosphate-dependent enzyme [Chloroflexota bacterium]